MAVTPEAIVNVNEALKLEPGGIYVIECECSLSHEQIAALGARLKEYGERIGVQFMILDSGLKIARKDDGARLERLVSAAFQTALAVTSPKWSQVENPAEVLVIAGNRSEFRAFAHSISEPKRACESTCRVLTPDTTYQFCTNAEGLEGSNFVAILKYGSYQTIAPVIIERLERQAELNAMRVHAHA